MRTSFAIAILVALFWTTGGWAGAVSIVNPNFDSPSCPLGNCAATGWTSFNGAVWTPAAGTFNTMPGGNTQAAWINYWPGPSPAPGDGWLDQVLWTDLAANTTYTLSIYVGDPVGDPFGGTVELLAGGNLLGDATGVTPTAQNWTIWTLTFDSAGSSFVGDALEIELFSSTVQSDFDNVTLTANADQQGVPEPAMFALVGAGLLGLVTRRRFVK